MGQPPCPPWPGQRRWRRRTACCPARAGRPRRSSSPRTLLASPPPSGPAGRRCCCRRDEHRLQLGQFSPAHDLDDRLPLPLAGLRHSAAALTSMAGHAGQSAPVPRPWAHEPLPGVPQPPTSPGPPGQAPRGSPPPLPSRQDSGRTGRDARHPPRIWPMARKYTPTGPEASCEYAPGSAASVSLYGGAPDPLGVRTGGREGTRWAAAAPARCAGDTQRSGQGGTCGQPPWTGTRKASPGKRRKIPGTPGSFREQARGTDRTGHPPRAAVAGSPATAGPPGAFPSAPCDAARRT
jgi:hypothetical protein